MQGFVDAGILASLFFVAASGYATTLYWDTNGSASGSGNAGGDWNTNAWWTTDSSGGTATGFYANLASATNDIYFSAGTDGTGTNTVTVTNVLAAYAVNKIAIEEGKVTLQGSPNYRAITLTGAGEINVSSNASLSLSYVKIAGSAGLTKTGAGTLTKNAGTDTYTGTTRIKEGTFIDDNNAIPDTSAVVIDAGAVLSFNSGGGRGDTVGSIAGSGSVWIKTPSDSLGLACGGDNSSTEFSGPMVAYTYRVGFFLKQGTGTLTLSSTNNTYTDKTLVSNGTLRVTGKHTGGGSYLVTSGATLGGNGTISMDTNYVIRLIGSDAANRAKLVPGTTGAGGTLTVSNKLGGTNVVFDVYSELAVSLTGDTATKLACGAMDLGGTNDFLTINVTGTRTRSRYVFATYTGSLAGNIFDHVTVTGVSNSRIDYSTPGEIAVILTRGTLISIF